MYKDVYGCEGVKVNEEGKFIKSKNGKEVKKTKAYRGEGYYIRYKGERIRPFMLMFKTYNPYKIEDIRGYDNLSNLSVEYLDGDVKNNALNNIRIKDKDEWKIQGGNIGVSRTHKEVVDKYWCYEDNKKEGITPEEITQGSMKEVWWGCEKGHKYKLPVSTQVRSVGCRECLKYNRVSIPQQMLYSIFKHNFKEVDVEVPIRREGEKGVYRADIYIKDVNLIIEYDGVPWHSTKEKVKSDKKKSEVFKRKLGSDLIRVRDEGCYPYECREWEKVYTYGSKEDSKINYKELKELGENICKELKGYVNHLKEEDYISYNNSLWYREDNRIFENHPYLEEYYSDKNKGDKRYLTSNSNKNILWECTVCNKEFKDMPNIISRKKIENVCPYCKEEREKYKRLKNKLKKRRVYRGGIRPIPYKQGVGVKEINKCKECNKYVGVRGTIYCSNNCLKKGTRKFDIPKEELENLLEEVPNFTDVGLRVNVSGNAVKKRCGELGISSNIKNYLNKYEDKKGYTYASYKNYLGIKERNPEKIEEVVKKHGKIPKTTIKKELKIGENTYNCIVKINNL